MSAATKERKAPLEQLVDEDLVLGRAELREVPHEASDGGGGDSGNSPPPEDARRGRGGGNRPPWRGWKVVLWAVLFLLSFISGALLGELGHIVERGWARPA